MHPSVCTHHFSDHPSDRTHQFSVHPSACTHHFLINHQIVLTNFLCTRQLVHIILLITHQNILFSDHPSDCIHEFSLCIRLRLDEVHTTFSDQRLVSISKPQERFLCKVCFDSLFTQATCTQDRLRHVYHMKIISFRLTADFQPDLSLSVFLERFSACTSETSCTIRLSQFEFPHLGTHVDRGSGVDHHQTFMGSWVKLPGCLSMGSWVPIPGCFPFVNFLYSATTFAQVYNIDFVFNRVA